jgi:3-oxo-5-alpha-steroid 4-dehydrogenase 1
VLKKLLVLASTFVMITPVVILSLNFAPRGMSLDDELKFHTLLCYNVILFFLVAAICLIAGITAPYGRYYSQDKNSFWLHGPPVPTLIAWVVQESPALVLPTWMTIVGWSSGASPLAQWPNRILLGMFIAHYFYRTLIFPVRLNSKRPVPSVVVFMAYLFCTVNGYIQGRYFSALASYPSTWLHDIRFITGVAFFTCGWFINFHSDNILFALRDSSAKACRETTQVADAASASKSNYKIPRGGMFEYVSGANYFGECLEWFGFALASWSLPGLTFAAATLLNVGPRAYEHHKWSYTLHLCSHCFKQHIQTYCTKACKHIGTRRPSDPRIPPIARH